MAHVIVLVVAPAYKGFISYVILFLCGVLLRGINCIKGNKNYSVHKIHIELLYALQACKKF